MDSSEQAELTNVPAQTSPTTVPQVRSRITVVCAECKRLKLKCDRKTPCGSCVKRDTLARCIYSPAAAEKVDLQSLNNRLMQVEATLAQLTSGQFVSSYPLSARPPPPSPSASKPLPASRQLAFVQAASGSAFTFPLEDVGSIWLDELDLGSSLASSSSQADPSTIHLKVEPDSIPILPIDNADASKPSCQPLPSVNIYYPASSPSSSSLSQSPCLSPALLGLLPPSVSSQQSAITSPHTLQNLLHLAENSVTHTYPSLNWKHLRSRAMKMVSLLDNSAQEKRAKAMEIFFGQRHISSPTADVLPDGDTGSKESVPFFATICAALALGSFIADRCEQNVDPMPDEQSTGRKGRTRKLPSSHSSANTASIPSVHSYTPPGPLYWYSLSVQALSVYEGSTVARVTGGASALDYDLDYLTACLLQVIFLLKCDYPMVAEECRDPSQKGVEGVIFPLVGKMVNIARQIGLTVDPEENNSGTTAVQNARKIKGKSNGAASSTIPHCTLFESEMRRRIWWDVLYYDLFVSDAMGHPPLIPEKSFSIRLPVTDVDDKAFCPSSSRIPVPRIEDSMGYMKDGLQYFEIKCRMAQLVRNIKRRMTSPEPVLTQFGHHSHPPGTYSIEQAGFMESEITTWLSQLPQCFRLDFGSSVSGTAAEPVLVAQRCEIAITAQRLIMKVYLPFLKKKDAAHLKPPYQATIAMGNAAHIIIHASKMLYKLWDSPCTPRDPNLRFPAMFDLYPLPRILFDAAVVSAYSVLKHPATWCASAAAEDADIAFDLLKRDEIWRSTRGLGLAGSFDIRQSDALHIVKCLRIKLQSNGSPSSMSLKRKLDAVDTDQVVEEQMPDQSQLIQTIPTMEIPESSSGERRHCPSPSIKESSARADSPPKGHSHEKKQPKRGPYPSVGVRVRPGREGSVPFSRPTTRSKDSAFFASSHSQISSDMLYRHSRHTDKETSPLPDSTMSRSRSSSITQDPVQKVVPQSPQLVAQAGFRVDHQNHSGYVGSPLIYEYSSNHHQRRTSSSDYSDSISPYTPTHSNGPLSAADSPYATTNVNTPTYGPSASTNSESFNPPHSYYANPPYNYSNGLGSHHSVHAFERDTGQSEGEPMSFTGTVCDTAPSAVYESQIGHAALAYQQVPLADTWPQPDYWQQSEYKHYS